LVKKNSVMNEYSISRVSRLFPTISLLWRGGTSTNAARRSAPLGTGEFGGTLFVPRIVRAGVFDRRRCLVDLHGAEGQSRQPSGLGCCSFSAPTTRCPRPRAAVAVFVLPLLPPHPNCPRSVEYGTVVEWYYVGNLDISPVLTPLVRFVLWRGGEVKLGTGRASPIRQNEQPS
jgi:hypothetical protein